MPYTSVALGLLDSYKVRFMGIGKSVDIIHDLDGASMFSLSKELGRKFVFTVHNFNAFMDRNILSMKGSDDIRGNIWLRIVQHSTKYKIERAAAIIAVSSNVKQFMVDFSGADKDKIFVVNHGVSPGFKPIPTKHDKFVVGTLSNLSPGKNPMFLVNAFITFKGMLSKKEQEGVELQLHGGPLIMSTALKAIDIAKAHGSIRLMGPVKQEKKVEMYNSFDVFAFPSFAETFGIPIIEAQACGLPVIINGNGIIPEETGKHCLRAYTSEEMADLFYGLDTKGYDKASARFSTEYAQGFTWDKAAKRDPEGI